MTRPNKPFLIIGAAALVIVSALVWLLVSSGGNVVPIGKRIHLLKDSSVPMRFKVIARSDGSAQVAVKFFDIDGKAVGRCEQRYAGSLIKLRLWDVAIDDRHLFFPYEMMQPSGDDTLRLPLQQFYARDGYPMVYDSRVALQDLKDAIRDIYADILACDTARFRRLYGTIRTIDILLSDPLERVNYSLSVTTGGEVGLATQ